jgi:hypothetical protein
MRHATAVKTSGGTKCAEATSQTDQLVRHAFVIMSACGVSMPVNKVSRLVRRYEHQVQGNGWKFFDFMANAMMLAAEDRSRMVTDYDVYKTICYLDRVGEEAVRNVMRDRGY